MSSTHFSASEIAAPEWLWNYLGIEPPAEAASFQLNDSEFSMLRGIPRARNNLSSNQEQTGSTFGFKWKKRDTFESDASLKRMREWLVQRYGNVATKEWLSAHGQKPLLIDAGCGAGMSGLELWGPVLEDIRYLGIDVSEAVDVAARRFAERGASCAFMQADISNLPLEESSVDLIFSEGVLHHTNSTRDALQSLAKLLKPGGKFLFYVYRRKGPVREFTDDYVRDKLQAMSPEEAWKAVEPLTQLGITLGQLNIELDIPKPIEILDIPAGKIDLQRLFYWHVAKLFYHPDLTFDEMNHINYDWYAPANARRHSIEEVREWCNQSGLNIEREVVEDAGITIIARKHN